MIVYFIRSNYNFEINYSMYQQIKIILFKIMVKFDYAFHNMIEEITGGYNDVFVKVKKKINNILYYYRPSEFWVGITSDGINGSRNRWNNKYKDLNMNHFAHIYSSSSNNFTKNLEDLLINYYSKYDELSNKIGGGSGNNGSLEPFIVYIAWKS